MKVCAMGLGGGERGEGFPFSVSFFPGSVYRTNLSKGNQVKIPEPGRG